MPRYISCLDVSNVSLGEGAGGSLSTGVNNILLGTRSGSAITTGTGNIVLGAATGVTDANDTITISSAVSGAIRARWDATGDIQMNIHDITNVPDPQPGFVTLGHDPTDKQVVLKHHDGTGVSVSRFRTDATIRSLVPLGTDSSVVANSVSLVRDASTRTLKRIAPGNNLSVETPVGDDCLVLHGPETSLSNASGLGVSVIANGPLHSGRTPPQGIPP